jgi:hypothetical protein
MDIGDIRDSGVVTGGGVADECTSRHRQNASSSTKASSEYGFRRHFPVIGEILCTTTECL